MSQPATLDERIDEICRTIPVDESSKHWADSGANSLQELSHSHSSLINVASNPKTYSLYREIATYTDDENIASRLYEKAEYPTPEYSIADLDVTQLVPDKFMEKLDLPSGLYGFTYLGTNYMAINRNLDYAPEI